MNIIKDNFYKSNISLNSNKINRLRKIICKSFWKNIIKNKKIYKKKS